MSELPIIIENGLDLGKSTALWIDSAVRRTKWTNRDIERRWGRRTADTIVKEGHTCYMNPCLDLTWVAAAIMQKNGIEHSIVFEENASTPGFPFNRIHFCLEFEDGDRLYHLNTKARGEVDVGEGPYFGVQDMKRIKMFRMRGDTFDYSLPLHTNLGHTNLPSAFHSIFHNYEPKKHLARLKRDNTPERFEQYTAKYGDKFRINVSQAA